MDKRDILIVFLLMVIVFLSVNLYNTRVNFGNNLQEITVEAQKEVIVFAGDSITDKYDLNKFYSYQNKLIINSGISGYKTLSIINRHDNLIEQHDPDKLFLMIGTNDLTTDRTNDEIVSNIEEIVAMTEKSNPKTKIYIESIYPVNRSLRGKDEKRYNKDIKYINSKLKTYCEKNKLTYIDVYSLLEDEEGNLKEEYTKDGLHLNDKGYTIVTKCLRPYVEE